MKFVRIKRVGDKEVAMFTNGCNLRCEYCYNHELTNGKVKDDIGGLEYLKKNRDIERIIISGGEPTIWKKRLPRFIKKVKALYPDIWIVLETNGTNPGLLSQILDYIDGVVIDFKGIKTYGRYLSQFRDSVKVLNESNIRYCTTVSLHGKYFPEPLHRVFGSALKEIQGSVVLRQIAYDTEEFEPMTSDLVEKLINVINNRCARCDHLEYNSDTNGRLR